MSKVVLLKEAENNLKEVYYLIVNGQ